MKKIFAVSLESINKCHALAVFDDNEQLIITHIEDIKGSPTSWKKDLLLDLKQKNQQGFACLVLDRTRSFSEHAASFSFDASESDGRTERWSPLFGQQIAIP